MLPKEGPQQLLDYWARRFLDPTTGKTYAEGKYDTTFYDPPDPETIRFQQPLELKDVDYARGGQGAAWVQVGAQLTKIGKELSQYGVVVAAQRAVPRPRTR